MEIYRHHSEVPDRGGRVVTIGIFDGVHLGHQALLQRTCELAQTHHNIPTVLTFDPHPAALLAPQHLPRQVAPLSDRLACFAKHGIAACLVEPFTAELAQMTPDEFFTQVLLEALHVRHIVVGTDFVFGRARAGTPAVLANIAHSYDVAVHFMPPISVDGERVSSTRLRLLLSSGDLAGAQRLTGG